MTKAHEADDKPEAAIDRLFEILETIPAEDSTIAASVLLGRFLADFGVEPYDDARWDAFFRIFGRNVAAQVRLYRNCHLH